mmetsp:Transcript_71993/g.141230  ORF Transcript_71993/g.141230 Transcript_71993/m.141230 type:complete len:243 (+) Transcript_71993:464-1192(+)
MGWRSCRQRRRLQNGQRGRLNRAWGGYRCHRRQQRGGAGGVHADRGQRGGVRAGLVGGRVGGPMCGEAGGASGGACAGGVRQAVVQSEVGVRHVVDGHVSRLVGVVNDAPDRLRELQHEPLVQSDGLLPDPVAVERHPHLFGRLPLGKQNHRTRVLEVSCRGAHPVACLAFERRRAVSSVPHTHRAAIVADAPDRGFSFRAFIKRAVACGLKGEGWGDGDEAVARHADLRGAHEPSLDRAVA